MKKKVLFINSVCGFGSTGNIVADLAKSRNYDSLVCFGRKKDYAGINAYNFNNIFGNCIGALRTIIFDNNLNICRTATKRLIKKIKNYNPDIIHLHNLHGYYINVEMLFKFLKEFNKPVVWTLHDCWSITGYCPHFDFIGCDKYKSKCSNCPYGFSYPFSFFKQNVAKEYKRKNELFNSLNNLTIVVPSEWLKSKIKESYIKNANIRIINNGIDVVEQIEDKNDEFTVLAVSSYWTKEKGVEELEKIVPLIDKDIQINIIGSINSRKFNYKNCTLIDKIYDRVSLYHYYSKAHILINPTLQDTFPTVNVESLTCGTPIISYKVGGCSEMLDDSNGILIDKNNYKEFANAINSLKNNYYFDPLTIKNAAKKYSKEEMIRKYTKLYNEL